MHSQTTPFTHLRIGTAMTTLGLLAAAVVGLLGGGAVQAQSLTVVPVNIEMTARQMATTLTVINHGDSATSVQIRAFAWKQPDGNEALTASDDVVVSPPIATIAPGASQVVRLVLRRAPQGQEATYRILLDQIPAAAAPGTVRIALRLSIPVFAEPATRVAASVKFRIESKDGQRYLVATNDGARHETVRDIAIKTTDGSALATTANTSPYILAGATRRWPVGAPGPMLAPPQSPPPGEILHLTGRMSTGAIDQQVPVDAAL